MPSIDEQVIGAGHRRLWRAAKRLVKDKDGVAAIEFSILAFPFFLLVFAIIETCVSFAAQQLLSNAMNDAARKVRTGNSQTITEAELKRFVCDKLIMIGQRSCDSYLFVDLRNYRTFQEAAEVSIAVQGGSRIQIVEHGSTTDPKTEPGGPSTINSLRVFYKWPVITDIMRKYMSTIDGNRTLLFATVTWQNEAFPQTAAAPGS